MNIDEAYRKIIVLTEALEHSTDIVSGMQENIDELKETETSLTADLQYTEDQVSVMQATIERLEDEAYKMNTAASRLVKLLDTLAIHRSVVAVESLLVRY